MRKLTSVLVLGCILGVIGCESKHAGAEAPAVGGVAILDLDKVAKTMGWVDDMQRSFKADEASLQKQMKDILDNEVKAINDTKNAIIKEAKLTEAQVAQLNAVKSGADLDAVPGLSKEQKQAIADIVNKANSDWLNAQQQYRNLLQASSAKLIMTYRERVRPIAGRVASSQGLSVVMLPADLVLYYDPKMADITDKVIEELQKLPPITAPVAPAPAPTTQP